eukprot:gene10036-12305_t
MITSTRITQLNQINSLILSEYSGLVYVWGSSGSGKLTSVLHALEATNKNGTATIKDKVLLYNEIRQKIVHILSNIYQKEKLSPNNSLRQSTTTAADATSTPIHQQQQQSKQSDIGLSYHSKCLLISSFLASSYSKTQDQLLYGKQRVKRENVKETAKTGLKWFTINRLLGILFALFENVKSKLNDSSELYHQIASLVSLKLLDQIGTLESIRLRCNVTYSNIKVIANSIRFDLDTQISIAEFSNTK